MSNHVNTNGRIPTNLSQSIPGSWFRFGLPLGSAMLMVACWDTVVNLFSLWIDMGGIFLYDEMENNEEFDALSIVWIFIAVVWIASNLVLLWFGVIFLGNLLCLKAWLATTLLCTLIYLCLSVYFLFEDWGIWEYFGSEVYSLIVFLIINSYIIYVAVQCVWAIQGNEPVLDPLGKGIRHIFKYYKENPALSAKFLLISELVFIGEYIFSRQILLSLFDHPGAGHEQDNSVGVIAEEYVIRLIRLGVSSVGLYIILKGKLPLLKIWGICYFSLIMSSVLIFIYLLFTWSSYHAMYTIGYYLLFCINISYRCLILFVVMKIAQPYTLSNSFVTLTES